MLMLQLPRPLYQAAVRAVPLQVGPVGKCAIQVGKLFYRDTPPFVSVGLLRLRGYKFSDVVVVGENAGHKKPYGISGIAHLFGSYLFLGKRAWELC